MKKEEEMLYQMKMKKMLIEDDLSYGKKKTKRDEAVLRGKIEELEELISLFEHLSEQETA